MKSLAQAIRTLETGVKPGALAVARIGPRTEIHHIPKIALPGAAGSVLVAAAKATTTIQNRWAALVDNGVHGRRICGTDLQIKQVATNANGPSEDTTYRGLFSAGSNCYVDARDRRYSEGDLLVSGLPAPGKHVLEGNFAARLARALARKDALRKFAKNGGAV